MLIISVHYVRKILIHHQKCQPLKLFFRICVKLAGYLSNCYKNDVYIPYQILNAENLIFKEKCDILP